MPGEASETTLTPQQMELEVQQVRWTAGVLLKSACSSCCSLKSVLHLCDQLCSESEEVMRVLRAAAMQKDAAAVQQLVSTNQQTAQ
jgi:hypothetical protein